MLGGLKESTHLVANKHRWTLSIIFIVQFLSEGSPWLTRRPSLLDSSDASNVIPNPIHTLYLVFDNLEVKISKKN